MSADALSEPRTVAMVQPFPECGRLLRLAYRELTIAANGDAEQVKALGPVAMLPRPWDPPTCQTPELRQQLWDWLEDVVNWLNREYVWDVAGIIPSCWPEHPHLVHEIAGVADQRRRAGLAFTSDAMEEWHRYALPAFADRMRTRGKDHCEEGHQSWPARSRYTRHIAEHAARDRHQAYAADVRSVVHERSDENGGQATRARLASVNLDTGEISEDS